MIKSATRILTLAISAGTVPAQGGLTAYDNLIASDNGGALPYTAVSTTEYVFDSTNNQAFDFGATSGSVTAEFIVKGDRELSGDSAYLAVGENSTHSLRFELWRNTGLLGFTTTGVADYLFTQNVDLPDNPLTNSPTETTHITYRWDHTTSVMQLFVNGVLTGQTVSPGFQFPSGEGFLGSDQNLGQGMSGTIDRVAVYNEALTPEVIASHSSAWSEGSLANYDTTIEADNTNNVAVYTAFKDSSTSFDTTNSEAFDFGAVTESATIEFIVQGDPDATGNVGYLGVGSDPVFSFRYEQWNDTGKLGYTRAGFADYQFGPLDRRGSPEEYTHVAYRYDVDAGRIELYIDGVLAGFRDGVATFEMPTGSGFLGNNSASTEGMSGEIARVTIYDQALTPEAISAHANAWLSPETEGPLLITDIDHAVDGDTVNVSMSWDSSANTNYLVETSLDLVNWEDLATSYPSQGESTNFVHSFAAETATIQRYYRVSVAPAAQ